MSSTAATIPFPVETADDAVYFAQPHMRDITPAVRRRQVIERAIVRKTAEALIAAGYMLRVKDGIEAGEYCSEPTKDVGVIMGAIMSTDDDLLLVLTTDGETVKRFGWVAFIYGNTGWDVTHDHTTNLEELLAPVSDYAEALSFYC